ncbi:hypothetical protein T11_6605 [Trichinella zimbabwensis]|uniref:Uncharacterized protein n=1 Tax=Trichinella zimbabwensis TaxID=268475 RepID=A0A0V1GCG4_9BILA|nr:hypothetical protein T11_6605 [Trichinella zimbabwensis]
MTLLLIDNCVEYLKFINSLLFPRGMSLALLSL